MSTRADIWSAVQARLALVPGVAIFADRTTPVSRDESPAIVVRRRELQERVQGNQSERRMMLTIAVITRDEVISQAVTAAENILILVHTHLLADQPTNFAGALKVGYVGTEWETESADQDACVVTATYDIFYRTPYQQL